MTGRSVADLIRATSGPTSPASRLGGAGDAGDRDVVDKTGGILQHLGQAFVIRGGRGQTDEIQTRSIRGNAEFFILFGWQVNHDQTINPRRLGICQEPVDAAIVDRVVVAHQHNRRRVVTLAELGRHFQCPLQRHARLKRALPGQLDCRAIGHRVGEGQSKLDDVDTRPRQAFDDFKRGVIIRVARHDIKRQTPFSLRAFSSANLASMRLMCFSCLVAPPLRQGAGKINAIRGFFAVLRIHVRNGGAHKLQFDLSAGASHF